MKKQNFFVTHGVWSMAITVLIVLTGVIAMMTLPVEQYPNIAPPTIYVSATYSGADATTIKKAVIMPLEDAINGVENVDYIYSTASADGSASINVVFKQGTDADMACVNVQNRVSKAQSSLPQEVTKIGVTVMKSQNSILQISGLKCTNGKFSEDFISNFVDINLMPRLKRINGVGNVQMLGNTYALRIWLKPDVMAMYGITPDDITMALAEQNLVSPTGSFEGKANKIDIEYKGQLQTLDEFRDIVIKSQPDGSILRINDIATVELGSDFYNFSTTLGKDPGVIFVVNQAPGANASQVNAEIFKLYEDVKKEMPSGMEFQTMTCSNDFLDASMHTVVETLIIAIILVVLVVFFFLQNGRATIIPAISIIVSMIGTFLIVMLAGFSLNLLTLFALVLAIGIVVDDAVVVVEAVEAKLEAGAKDVAQATSDAMSEVSMAVVSCTLVFMAVFIPVTFMQGTQGTFFTQFGITMAAAVGLSMVNALTMCPALCAMMLKPKSEGGKGKGLAYWTKKAYEASFTAISTKYNKAIGMWIKRPALSFIALALATAGMAFLMMYAQEDFVPEEDQGVVLVDVAMGPGASTGETQKALDKIEKIVEKIPEVESYSKTVGWGIASGIGQNFGTIILHLKNWEERGAFSGLQLTYTDLPAMLGKEVPEATVSAFQMPQIPGYGTGSFIDFYVQDRSGSDDMNAFSDLAQQFQQKLCQHPDVAFASTSYSLEYPKDAVDIDAAACKRMGVSPSQVLSTLGTYLAGNYVSNYTQFGKVYYVKTQAEKKYRESEEGLSNIFVKAGNGKMVPITQFAKITPKLSSAFEKRMNLYSAIQFSAMPASGKSKSDVRKAIAETFSQVFPSGYGYEYAGMAREEDQSAKSNMTGFIYGICILLIYLILACLYNSLWIPFSVLLAIPFGLFGTYLFAKPLEFALGNGNNIYLQTGVIMLMGLVAKTAILITEYAVQHHENGESALQASFAAAKERLRPIMMTVMAMILGMVPLALETGAGARGNMSLAFGVIGGMTIGSISLLFVTPAFYIVFQNIHDKLSGKNSKALLAGIAITLCLTNCGVCKPYESDFKVPENNVPQWRQVFTDPCLQALIDSTLKNNADAKTAAMNIEKAEIAYKTSRMAYLPTVGFAGQGGIKALKNSDSSGSTWTYSLGITAAWQLDFFGRTITNTKQLKKASLAYQHDYEQAVQCQLISSVAQLYYKVLGMEKQLRILQEMAVLYNNTYTSAQQLFEAGLYTSPAVYETKAQMENINVTILELKSNIQTAKNALCKLMDDTPHDIALGTLDDLKLPSLMDYGVKVEQLNYRPDVRAAERALEMAYYTTQIKKGALYPSITISADGGWMNPTTWFVQGIGSLVQPIFQGGKLRADLNIAKIDQQIAVVNFRKTVIDAANDVANAMEECRLADCKKAGLRAQVVALEQSVDATQELMNNSSATYIEVLTAMKELLTARNAEVQNQTDAATGLVNLYGALGGR